MKLNIPAVGLYLSMLELRCTTPGIGLTESEFIDMRRVTHALYDEIARPYRRRWWQFWKPRA